MVGVADGNDVSDGVAVGGIFVLVGAVVGDDGTGELVGAEVDVAGCVGLGVAVLGTLVMPAVLVGPLGTQSTCPV